MRGQNKWTGMVMGVVLGVLFSAAVVLAGGLEPSVGPTAAGSQMVTLEQIYNRINNGTAATKNLTFTEPGSGPTTGTMHTLDEIYNLVGLRAPIARTGQTLCYDELGDLTSCATGVGIGQDGDLKKGVAWPIPRFTDKQDGTVTDNLTGLIWLRDANCTNFFSGDNTGLNNRNWANALTAPNSLASGRCGLTDGSTAGQWRLPNRHELFSLIDDSKYGPALPTGHPFTGVQHELISYWSSTTQAPGTVTAWSVHLEVGDVYVGYKYNTYHVWPVRGGQ